jgi:beta-phosphoglucomutase
MKNPDAVVFDMDGVLIDTHRCAYKIPSECIAKYGVILPADELIMTWGSLSSKQFWSKVKHDYGIPEDLNVLVNSYDYNKEMSYYPDLGLTPGVEKLIDMLDRSNVLIGLATSAEMIRVRKVLSLGEIAQKFSCIISANDVKKHKPDPECYIKACERLKVAPSRTLVIEDSSNGANAAKSAGCVVAAFHGSMWSHDPFEADIHIESFEKIEDIRDLWPNKTNAGDI